MSLFGRKSTSSASANGQPISSEEVTAVLSQMIGAWCGEVTQIDPAENSNGVTPIDKRFHPSPDGWHIIVNNSVGSGREPEENFEVIALHPTRSEITFTEFSAGHSNQVIYSLHECTNSRGKARLILQSMGWDREEPCEIRLIYELSNRALSIEMQKRPTTKGGTFHTVEISKMSRSR